jgi:hypothetical protein
MFDKYPTIQCYKHWEADDLRPVTVEFEVEKVAMGEAFAQVT